MGRSNNNVLLHGGLVEKKSYDCFLTGKSYPQPFNTASFESSQTPFLQQMKAIIPDVSNMLLGKGQILNNVLYSVRDQNVLMRPLDRTVEEQVERTSRQVATLKREK